MTFLAKPLVGTCALALVLDLFARGGVNSSNTKNVNASVHMAVVP